MRRLTKRDCFRWREAIRNDWLWFYLYFPRIGGILRAMFRWFGVSFATHRATRYVYTRIYSNAFSISRIALTDREASLNTAIISPSPSPLSPLNHRRKIDAFIVDLVPIFTPSSPRIQGRKLQNNKGGGGVNFVVRETSRYQSLFPLTFEVIKCKWFRF